MDDDSNDTPSNKSDSLNGMLTYNGDSEYSTTNLDDESHLPYAVTENEQLNLVNSLSDILKMLDYNKKHLDSFTKHFEHLTRAIKVLLTKVSIILENEVDAIGGIHINENETSLDQNQSQPKQIIILENQLMTKGLNTATGMEKKKNGTNSKSVEVEDSGMELFVNEDSLNKGRLSKPRLCKTKAMSDESLLKYATMTGKLNKSRKLVNLEVEPGSSGYKLNEETVSKTRVPKKKVMGVTNSLKSTVPTGLKIKKNEKEIKSGGVGNSEMEPGTCGDILNRVLKPRLCKSKAMTDENLLKYAILTGKLSNKNLKLNEEKLSKTGLCEKKGKNCTNEGKRAAYKRKAASLDGLFNKRVKKNEKTTRSFVASSPNAEASKKKLYSSEDWLHSLTTSFL